MSVNVPPISTASEYVTLHSDELCLPIRSSGHPFSKVETQSDKLLRASAGIAALVILVRPLHVRLQFSERRRSPNLNSRSIGARLHRHHFGRNAGSVHKLRRLCVP